MAPLLFFGAWVDARDFARAFSITTLLFAVIFACSLAYASTVTLSVAVNTSITFTTTTDNFTSITPGTAVFATTTLSVTTNDASGWNVKLAGDWKGTASGQNLQLLSGGATTTIQDQTEWIPGGATTSAGNAVRIGSLQNSANVLAFRVMTASSSNGVAFLATSWWGTADNYTDNANTLWAGIASTTGNPQIGSAGTGTYSASAHLNTVTYYLNVASSQKTGTYNAPITYTATGN